MFKFVITHKIGEDMVEDTAKIEIRPSQLVDILSEGVTKNCFCEFELENGKALLIRASNIVAMHQL